MAKRSEENVDWRENPPRLLRGSGALLVSKPPSGKCKVINIYVDPDTGKTIVEYENTPVE